MSIGSSTAARGGGLSRYTFAGILATALVIAAGLAVAVGLTSSHHGAAHGQAGLRSSQPAARPVDAHGARAGQASVSARAGALAGSPGKKAGQGARSLAGARGLAGQSAHGGAGATTGGHGAQALVLAGPQGATVAEVRDPEESKSFPLPRSTHHRAASTPSVAAEAVVAPGAASDAEVRKELREEEHAMAQERAARQRILTAPAGAAGGSSVGGNGTIPIPTDVPEVVQRVIAGGNAIADFPYIWGGGHGSFVDHGYDCSGSVSYALAAGGLLSAPLVSGDLASWGEPGPGRWITIYANAGHTFMYVDGIWFDTAGRSGPYASRWITATPPLAGYAVRHPPGL